MQPDNPLRASCRWRFGGMEAPGRRAKHYPSALDVASLSPPPAEPNGPFLRWDVPTPCRCSARKRASKEGLLWLDGPVGPALTCADEFIIIYRRSWTLGDVSRPGDGLNLGYSPFPTPASPSTRHGWFVGLICRRQQLVAVKPWSLTGRRHSTRCWHGRKVVAGCQLEPVPPGTAGGAGTSQPDAGPAADKEPRPA